MLLVLFLLFDPFVPPKVVLLRWSSSWIFAWASFSSEKRVCCPRQKVLGTRKTCHFPRGWGWILSPKESSSERQSGKLNVKLSSCILKVSSLINLVVTLKAQSTVTRSASVHYSRLWPVPTTAGLSDSSFLSLERLVSAAWSLEREVVEQIFGKLLAFFHPNFMRICPRTLNSVGFSLKPYVFLLVLWSFFFSSSALRCLWPSPSLQKVSNSLANWKRMLLYVSARSGDNVQLSASKLLKLAHID